MFKKPPQTDAANLLLIAEYQALRVEIMQCLQHTQSIVQWSLAAYGVLFGAGIVAASDGMSRTDSFLRMAVLLIFMALIPGLSFAATLNWLGEITRMERAAVYLRGVEHALRKNPTPNLLGAGRAPLNWDRYLAARGKSEKIRKSRKITGPYVGIALLFSAGFIGSLAMAFLWMNSEFGEPADTWTRDLFPWWVGGVLAAYLGTCVHLGIQVYGLRKKRYCHEIDDLVDWPEAVPS